jgi:hypothetical protein
MQKENVTRGYKLRELLFIDHIIMEEKTSTKVILYGNNKHAWLVFWTGLKIQ